MSEVVLIVDDDPVQRRLVEAMVQRFGYQARTADGGDAAIAILLGDNAIRVDCVVLDLVMPDLDGLGVLARMRQGFDTHSGLPLLTLERLTYRFVAAGFVLLSATLVVGYWFGDLVYGNDHAWRWDHKTVFSMLAWLTFATLLLGRARFGWRGRRAVGVLYTGAVFLFLAYVGSRFVIEVILGRSA